MRGVEYFYVYFMFLFLIISEDTTYRQPMIKITEPTTCTKSNYIRYVKWRIRGLIE